MKLIQELEQKLDNVVMHEPILLSEMINNDQGSIKLYAIPHVIEDVVLWNLEALHRYRFNLEPFKSTSLVVTDRSLRTIKDKWENISFDNWNKALKRADTLVLLSEEYKTNNKGDNIDKY
tara:strand:- start:871 stop:1230 length:360 start_codon:yes stop_codon:yes gene_type:complete